MRQSISGSSLVSEVDYNESTKILTLHLVNGKVLRYEGVPPTIVTQMLESPSVGKYYNQNIKGVYPKL